MSESISKKMARGWFVRCLSCSEAMFTILNRGRGIEQPLLEQASHPLAGGFLRQGRACGMAWGEGLAIGVRAVRKFSDAADAADAALAAKIVVGGEFARVAGSIDCREITGCDLTTVSGRLRYIYSGKANLCTRLCVKWAPVADGRIEEEFANRRRSAGPVINCGVEALRGCARALEMEVDPVTAAAFAGGLGLSGNVCGALAAAVLAEGMWFYRARSGPRDGLIKAALQEMGVGGSLSRGPERLRREFRRRFGSELCIEIAGRKFSSRAELYDYLGSGGCAEIIKALPEMATAAVLHGSRAVSI